MRKKETKISTIIGKGTVINGDFIVLGSVRVDGTVDGSVKSNGTLIMGAAGKITGNIEAAVAIIGGEVCGDIIAPDKVEITETAKVIGDLKTNLIVIDEKAIFQGKCDMNQEVAEGMKAKKRLVRETKAGKKSAKDALKEALLEVEAEENNEKEAFAQVIDTPENA